MNNNIVACMDTLSTYIVSVVSLQIKLLTACQKVIFDKIEIRGFATTTSNIMGHLLCWMFVLSKSSWWKF
jgi:hypothetical protein